MKRQKLARRKQQRNAALEDRLAREAEAALTPREDLASDLLANWMAMNPRITAGFTKNRLHGLGSRVIHRSTLRGVSLTHVFDTETAPLHPFFGSSLMRKVTNGSILDSAASIQRNQLELPRVPDRRLRRATNLASTFTEVFTREILGPCVSVPLPEPQDPEPIEGWTGF